MPQKRYIVDLSSAERDELLALTSKGTVRARQMKRAQILLKAADGATDAAIVAALNVSRPCVERVRKRFVAGGFARAFSEDPRPGQKRKLGGEQNPRFIAETPSAPPRRHERRGVGV